MCHHPLMRQDGRARALLVACLALLGCGTTMVIMTGVSPAAADVARGPYTITLHGNDGPKTYHERNSELQMWSGAGGSYDVLSLFLYRSRNGQRELVFTFRVAPPSASSRGLMPGSYLWGTNWMTDPSRPELEVGYTGAGCNTEVGHFEIRDLERAADGRIARVWMLYERRCDTGSAGWGEVRIGYPRMPVEVQPHAVSIPATTEPNENPGEPHPVRIRLGSATAATARGPFLAGRDHDSYQIVANDCGGQLTRAGCLVWVAFAPLSAGPQQARLVVPTSEGAVHTDLDAVGAQGTSRWTVDSEERGEHFTLEYSRDGDHANDLWSQAWPALDSSAMWQLRLITYGEPIMPGDIFPWKEESEWHVSVGSHALSDGAESGWLRIDDIAWEGPDRRLTRYDVAAHLYLDNPFPVTYDIRVQFQDRDDVTPPGPVADLVASRTGRTVSVSWTPSATAEEYIVRWVPGRRAPQLPTHGRVAVLESMSSGHFRAPRGRSVAIAVWAYDASANRSGRRVVRLTN